MGTSNNEDLDLLDPYRISFRDAARRLAVNEIMFSAAPDIAVILGVGQSNIANEGDAGGLCEPGNGVYNFNFFDAKCYVAKDPLLGASKNRSNVLTRLGDMLVARRHYQRVLLVPIAHGGTYATDWSPGGKMFPRLRRTLALLRQQDIKITHVLWQQGESEAAQDPAEPDAWVRHFMAMVAAIRQAGVDAPIYVAQCTICRNEPSEPIRSAQRRVVVPALGILAGPDIDLIGLEDRYDGCHFSTAGLRRAAQMWSDALAADSDQR